jgi:hypothetical protein
MGRKCFALVAAVAATASLFNGYGSAYGALTFNVSGQITSNAYWDGMPIPPGTPVTVSGSLDPNTPDGSGDPSFGAYDDPAGAITLIVGGHTIDLTGCTAYVQDNYVPGNGAADQIVFVGYAPASDGLTYSIQAGFLYPPALFDGDSLANVLLLNSVRPWTTAQIYLFAYTDTGGSAGRYFTTMAIDGVTVSVPEPSAAMSALGLTGIGLLAHRRRGSGRASCAD